jgi:hypothetical protein
MKTWIQKLLFGVILASSALLLGACVGYVGPGDYYGPDYGGAIIYSHPYYGGGGGFWGGPGGRRWR